ncbi:MAG: hypothetical protein AABZ53_04070, partial [Planctomycetota bacterium]
TPMQVYLDDQLVPIDRPSLRLALATAARVAESKGRVIVAALADGTPVADQVLQAPTDEFSSIVELKLRSASPAQIVGELLQHAAEAVDSVRDTQQHAANLVQAGNLKAVTEPLQTIFTVWQAVSDGLSNAATMLDIDLSTQRVPDGTGGALAIAPLIEILVERLTSLRAALQNGDVSALADCLAYDLEDSAKDWSAMLRGLREVLSKVP